MEFIKIFTQLNKNNAPIAGGKGASLGEMTQAGIPVPPGFVILSETFDHFLSETDLTQEIELILKKINHNEIHAVESASEEIRNLILHKDIPADIEEGIIKSFKELNATYVAVRSSATAEDGADHAWAGQLETYLNTTEEDLLRNVKLCWSSLFTPRAIFYRFEKELDQTKISVAVVIQKMVESEVSGIAFSVHPVTEDYNQLIIEAGFGLGEAIVSGAVTPDSYIVTKNSREIDINVFTQSRALYRSVNKNTEDGNNEWKIISEPQASSQVLTNDQILELTEIIITIENHYGFPCDIEWAYEKGKFYIVQSRPITTLKGNIDLLIKTKEVNFKKEDYVITFWASGVSIIYTDMVKDMYLPYDPLLCIYENKYYQYLSKTAYDQAGKDGIDLYGNKEAYYKYEEDLKKVSLDFKRFRDKRISETFITKEILEDFIMYSSKLHRGYSKMGYEHTDKAFSLANENPIIAETLKEVSIFKDQIRAVINEMYFEKGSLLENLLIRLENQFHVSSGDLLNYTQQELLNLFDGSFVSKEELETRALGFAIQGIGGEIKFFTGKVVEKIINQLAEHILDNRNEIKGIIANKGKVSGRVKKINVDYSDFTKLNQEIEKMKNGEILVAETTAPELIIACRKASAIVTDQGGLMSHAAIISREFNIPCIVGTKYASQILQDGDEVEVDADKGIIKILKKADRENYLFYYESQGYYFILDDLIVESYIDWPIVEMRRGDWKRVYMTEEDIQENYLKGLSFTEKEIKKKTDNIRRLIEKIRKVNFNNAPKEIILSGLQMMEDLFESYKYLDTSFSEGLYEKNISDLRVLIIEQSKNLIRDDFDYIFFKDGGILRQLLTATALLTGTKAEDIRWYRTKELKRLINEPYEISSSEIQARSKAAVFDKDRNGNITFYSGQEAEDFIQKFDKEFEKDKTEVLKGTVAYGNGGKIKGIVTIIHRDYSNLSKLGIDMERMAPGSILITTITDPEFLPAMKKASAIVTDIGGLLSHAAISARELKVPCIVGTQIATKTLKDGDEIEIDMNTGAIKFLS
ncbi:MAG: hypothetical protein JWN37_516 [Candidatus Nomurabacteria bacterium]|nr:hypothetical protein [Candidatus Nomurabacteria bacterium]